MRNSIKLQAQAMEAHKADIARDRSKTLASIDDDRNLIAILEEARKQDLQFVDATAETSRANINRRIDGIVHNVETRIKASEAHLRDLDGGEAERKQEAAQDAGGDDEQPATVTPIKKRTA